MNDKIRFFEVLRAYPNIARLFDQEKDCYSPEGYEQFMGYASSGERIMAQFFVSVWTHQNDFDFDLLNAAGTLDESNRAVIAAWLVHPYWP